MSMMATAISFVLLTFRAKKSRDTGDVHFLSTFLPKKKKQGESLAFKSRQTERMESVEDGLESTRGVG